MPTEWPLPVDSNDEPQFLMGFNSVTGHRLRLWYRPSQMLAAMDVCLGWYRSGLCHLHEAESAMDRIGAVCDNYRTGRKLAAILGR